MPVYTLQGQGQQLEVYDDKIVIVPGRGLSALITRGVSGPKTIPYASITAIEHKKAGFANGFLQFIIPGGVDRAPFQDPNTFIYSHISDNNRVTEVKQFIEGKVKAIRERQSASGSPADELRQLAELKTQGLLSDDEFSKAKRRILGD
jgi:hypothetical protein